MHIVDSILHFHDANEQDEESIEFQMVGSMQCRSVVWRRWVFSNINTLWDQHHTSDVNGKKNPEERNDFSWCNGKNVTEFQIVSQLWNHNIWQHPSVYVAETSEGQEVIKIDASYKPSLCRTNNSWVVFIDTISFWSNKSWVDIP